MALSTSDCTASKQRLDPEESRSQLDGFAASGYGGVMIMPWGGLPNDFMDESLTLRLAHQA